jgi:phenylalanyl-tRNA synthetase beta chain
LGFDEAISYSFIDAKFDGVFETLPGLIDEQQEEKFVTLQDSVIEGAIRMRPSILPGLLDAARLNFNQQRRDLKLFELGKVFAARSSETNLPAEQEFFSLVVTGSEMSENKAMPVRPLDFYDAKGALEAALDAVGVTDLEFKQADVKHLRPGQAASISIGGTNLGFLGRLNEEISGNYKFKQRYSSPRSICRRHSRRNRHRLHIARCLSTPASYVTFPSQLNRQIGYADIKNAVLDQHVELCRSIEFVDVYEGKGLDENERSITIRLEYRSDERTLVETETEAVHKQIVADVESKLGVKQRI